MVLLHLDTLKKFLRFVMAELEEHKSDSEMLIDDTISEHEALYERTPSPPPRLEGLRHCLNEYCYNKICNEETSKQLYATIYILLSTIPIITAVIQTIITTQTPIICNEPNGESLGLLLLTLTIFIFTLYLIVNYNGNYNGNKSLKLPIAASITFIILYILQFGLIIHIFNSHQNVCNDMYTLSHISYYLLLCCIMIYSVIFLTFMVIFSCWINSKASNGYGRSGEIYVLIAAVICQFGVVCIPSSLQMMLITTAHCDDNGDISILETVLLPIMTMATCIFGIFVIYTKESVLFGVVCLLLFISYGFVLHSCVTWNDESVDCGEEYEEMKLAAFVFFVIIAIEYSVIVIGVILYGFIYRLCEDGF